MENPKPPDQQHISAEDARGGDIVLASGLQRAIFIGGLLAAILVALILIVRASG